MVSQSPAFRGEGFECRVTLAGMRIKDSGSPRQRSVHVPLNTDHWARRIVYKRVRQTVHVGDLIPALTAADHQQAVRRALVQNLITHRQARLHLLHSKCNSCIACAMTAAFLLSISFRLKRSGV